MAVTPKRPITPAQRGMTSRDFSELDSQVKTPTKLKKAKQRISGRNAHGRITVRRRGGGSKRFYRLIQDLPKGKAEVISIDYDPNRSAHIALLQTDKEQVYVLASKDMKVGEKIEVGNAENVSSTNRLALKDIPNGTAIYNIELEPGKGGQMVKSAGASAQIVAKEEGQIQVKLPSGEIRLFNENCMATIGSVGNDQHQNVKWGAAGRRRKMGRRPKVRGKAMNAVDHPHGGGDGGAHGIGGGKSHGRTQYTPWGQKTVGYKTRKNKRTDKYIVKSRHQGKRD